MSSSITTQTVALDRLAAIRALTFQSLVSATSTSGTDMALLDSASSLVQLSALGQVLANDTALQTSLEALQSSTASVVAAAQDFAAAFNTLQQSIDSIVPSLGTLPDSALITQLLQTLNAAASSATGGANPDLSALQAIGLPLIAASSTDSTQTSARLSIDQATLNAAVQADAQGTATLLAQATQSLLQQVTLFEVQATNSSGLASAASGSATVVSTDQLQNLSADTILNTMQLTDLDLAAVGLDVATIQSNSSVLDTSLAATLAESTSANVLTVADEVTSSPTPNASSAAPLASATQTTATVASVETAVVVAPIAAAASQTLPQTTIETSTNTVFADQGALDATRILRTRWPTRRCATLFSTRLIRSSSHRLTRSTSRCPCQRSTQALSRLISPRRSCR